MVNTKTQYRYECDHCPRMSNWLDDQLDLHDILFNKEKGWSEYESKHYCPECSKWEVPGYPGSYRSA